MCEKTRLSIGMPVFNGEKYLKEALDSILAQSYPDFELIISDNASTDRTPQICRAYAAKDSRIRYYRNKRNVGASKNFNRVFKLSSGKYFKWAAHDDLLAPEFLSRCINVLDQDSSIVLCYTKASWIDEHGKLVSTQDYKMRIDSQKPHERFGELLSFHYPPNAIFGVMRAGSLRMTPLIGEYIGSDRNLLAEIGLIGRIHEIAEYLFFRRKHPDSFTDRVYAVHAVSQDLLDWWNPATSWRLIFTYNCLEYFRSVRRVPLTWSERLLCYAQIAKWFIREGWSLMYYDVEMSLLRCLSLERKADPVVKILIRARKRLGGIK